MSRKSSSRSSSSSSQTQPEPEAPKENRSPNPRPMADAVLAMVLAWAIPGAGHMLLGRRRRGVAFCVLVMACAITGCLLEGRLWWVWSGSPLSVLATLGCLGMGLPSLVLHYALDYQGVVTAPWYEHGSAFILTSGLMNLLLVLDAWDIARGTKS